MKTFSVFLLLLSCAAALAGDNLIVNGDFATGLEGWRLDRMENAQAAVEIRDADDGRSAAVVKVLQQAEKRYFVQLAQKGVSLDADKTYRLTFRGRADPEASIVLKLLENQSPFLELWSEDHIALNGDWKEITFEFKPKASQDDAVLVLSGLAQQPGEYWFTDVSLSVVK
jgi:hypothetical protein